MSSAPPVMTQRPRSPFIAILVYTLQSCFPRKRWMAVLVPCAGALLFGLLAYAVNQSAQRSFATVAADGTFHFTWLSPTPTWQIVLGRWLGGSLVALVTIAPAAALAAIIAGSPESAA